MYSARRHRSRSAPGCFLFSLAAFLAALGAVCVLLLALVMPNSFIGLKVESLRYRVQEALPQPEHPDFVPTPFPTRLALARPTRTPSAVPTDEPTSTAVPSAQVTLLPTRTATRLPTTAPSPTTVPVPAVDLAAVRPNVTISGIVHEFQRWNNCGPTTLKMYLSYFGDIEQQTDIAAVLKPDPDDKNVSPDEIANFAESKGYHALVRVNGNVDQLKLILSNNLPVMIESGYDPPELHKGWMGHYLLMSGYTDTSFITQDSYEGPNRAVPFAALDDTWHHFDRTYILLYHDSQAPLIRALVGADMDDGTMFAHALARAQSELEANPKDAFAAFNMGSALVGLQRYDDAAAAYDTARSIKLPWRMLWYQFGAYEAYYQVGRYDELIALTDATQKTVGDLEESYYYKGLALAKLGRADEARQNFELALKYNKNFRLAQIELAKLEQS